MVLALLATAALPRAQTGGTWTEVSPGVYVWNTGTLWNPALPTSVAGSTASFTATLNGGQIVNLTGTGSGSTGPTVGTLIIGGGSTGYLLTGGSITLDNGAGTAIINDTSLSTIGGDTISAVIVANSNLSVGTATSGRILTISGLITDLGTGGGTAGFTKTGAGEVDLLSTGNKFGGALTVQQGILGITSLAGSYASGSNGAGNIVLGDSTNNFGVTLKNLGSLNIVASRGLTINTSGGGTLDTSTSLGTLALTGNINYANTSAPGTLTLIGSNTGLANVLSGVITDSGASHALTITKAGTGTWSITGTNNTFTGGLNVNAGILNVDAFSNSLNGAQAISLGGGTLGYIGGSTSLNTLATTTTRSLNLAASSVIQNSNPAATITFGAFSNGSGAHTLTLQGVGTGVISGNMADNGGALAITKNGAGLWSLSGSNTITGAIAMNLGTIRFTGANALGGTGANVSFANAPTLIEMRGDNSPTYSLNLVLNSAPAGANPTIYVDHAIGGAGTQNGTVNMGMFMQHNSSAVAYVAGDHGYSLYTSDLRAAGGQASVTLNNYLSAPGYVLNSYTPGTFQAGLVDTDTAAGATSLILAGWSDYNFPSIQATNAGTNLTLTKSGTGVLTISGNNSNWTAQITGAGGTLTASAGVTRITNSGAFGNSILALNGGVVEFHGDSNMTFTGTGGGSTSLVAASTVVLDHSITGGVNTGITVNLPSLAGTKSVALNVVGDRGYGLAIGAAGVSGSTLSVYGGTTVTLNNYLSAPGYNYGGAFTTGVLALNNVTTDASAGAANLTLSGPGDYTLGAISSSNAGTSMNITKSNLGVITFNTANSAWTSTAQGTLSTTAGTTRIDGSVANVLGSAQIGLAGGMTEIRNSGNTSLTSNGVFLSAASTFVAAPRIGDPNASYTLSLGSLTTTAASTATLDTNHGTNITFNAATEAAFTATLNNIGTGTVTFTNGLNTTGAGGYVLGGYGDYYVPAQGTTQTAGSSMTKNGYSTVTLAANAWGGSLTLNSGIVRLTGTNALSSAVAGGSITVTGGNNGGQGTPAIDLRSSTAIDNSKPNFVTNDYNFLINVDRAIGDNSTTNVTQFLGGGTIGGASGWGAVLSGANGFSLQFGSASNTTPVSIATNLAYTFTNYIPSIGGNGGVIFNSGLAFAGIAAGSTMTLAGPGDFQLTGNLSTTGTPTAGASLTKSGAGAFTISSNNASTWNTTTFSVYNAALGITRLTNGGGLGGANATVNLNGGALDLRSDAGITVAAPITVGTTSAINVDRAISGSGTVGTQTINSLKDNGVFTVYTTGGGQSSTYPYSLTVNTFTVAGAATAAAPTVVNSIGNGGALNIGTLTGAGLATLINGPGNTNVTTALTLGAGADQERHRHPDH